MRKTFLEMSYWQNLPSSGSCQGAASQECALPLPILLTSDQKDHGPSLGQMVLLGQISVGGGKGGSHFMNMAAPTVTRWQKIWSVSFDSKTLLSLQGVEKYHARYG